MSERLEALSASGVSVWLDDLSRERIETGNLAGLVTDSSVVGVTTNPTIFAKALADGERYAAQLAELKATGADLDAAIFELTTEDVRNACDLLDGVYERTGGVDGRVSIEVDPRLARDTPGTVEMAHRLWAAVDRPNLFIKIPATPQGLPAIADAIAAGISVNVTLIFSLDRYREVMDAYLSGLERAAEAGLDLADIQSVASFFVSRVDSEVDARLQAAGHTELAGKAGIANARLAYEAFEEVFAGSRFSPLRDKGAKVQRPLWASTGVKNPDYPDTMYVTELVTAATVNTMPEATLRAFADHGEIHGDTVRGTYAESRAVLDKLADVGISYNEVVDLLEQEGVEKFEASWAELAETVKAQLDRA